MKRREKTKGGKVFDARKSQKPFFMTIKEDRRYVTQEELERIKQLPRKVAQFERGRFTGLYDENSETFYLLDQYGRLSGVTAHVPREKFTEPVQKVREDTVQDYAARKSSAAVQPAKDQHQAIDKKEKDIANDTAKQKKDSPLPSSNRDSSSSEPEDTRKAHIPEKKSADVFAKKKKKKKNPWPFICIALFIVGMLLGAAYFYFFSNL